MLAVAGAVAAAAPQYSSGTGPALLAAEPGANPADVVIQVSVLFKLKVERPRPRLFKRFLDEKRRLCCAAKTLANTAPNFSARRVPRSPGRRGLKCLAIRYGRASRTLRRGPRRASPAPPTSSGRLSSAPSRGLSRENSLRSPPVFPCHQATAAHSLARRTWPVVCPWPRPRRAPLLRARNASRPSC